MKHHKILLIAFMMASLLSSGFSFLYYEKNEYPKYECTVPDDWDYKIEGSPCAQAIEGYPGALRGWPLSYIEEPSYSGYTSPFGSRHVNRDINFSLYLFIGNVAIYFAVYSGLYIMGNMLKKRYFFKKPNNNNKTTI